MSDPASTSSLGSSLPHPLRRPKRKHSDGPTDNDVSNQEDEPKDEDDKKEKDCWYSPIDGTANEIRLVTLHSARQDDEPIKCSLQNATLFSGTDYEALSYPWGDPELTRPILLDEASFEVTNNLYNALLNLRQPDQHRTMWIDAICINQKDSAERGVQVSLMHDVYRQARQVVVWLGTYSELEDDQVTFFKNLGVETDSSKFIPQAFVLIEDLGGWYMKVRLKKPKIFEESITSSQSLHAWAALFALFNRSWFTRLWVFQELRLARKSPVGQISENKEAVMVCGRCSVSWLNFYVAALIVSGPFRPPYYMLEGTPGKWHQDLRMLAARVYNFSFSRESYTLMQLLDKTNRLVCTDPRDKLLALLGLASSEDQKDMNVGYSQNVEQSYTEWARMRIRRLNSLDVMTLCVDSVTKGLPSWVPDLRTCFDEYDEDLFQQIGCSRQRGGFAASGTLEASWAFSAGNKVVSMMGYEIDSVIAISPPHHPRMKDAIQVRKMLQNWEDTVYNALGTHPALNWEFYRKFSNVIFCGGKDGDSPHSLSFHEQLIAWRRQQVQNDLGKISAMDTSLNSGLMQRIYNRLQLSQIFVTSTGSLGVVRNNCHINEGDRVYVLRGGDMPFILRRTGDEQDHLNDYPGQKMILQEGYTLLKDGTTGFIEQPIRPHRLMGPCYLYGAMDGEIISRWRRDEIDFKIVTLG